MKQELYWVCWYKHGDIQNAVHGPYPDWGFAEETRNMMDNPENYRIGKSIVEIEEV